MQKRFLLVLASAALVAVGNSTVLAGDEFTAVSEAVLDRPHDMVLSPDSRYLYVAEVGANRVAVLDPTSLVVLGVFGENDLSGPHDVDFNQAGQLLVADTHNHRLAIYRVEGVSGTLIDEIRGAINKPEGVDVALDGTVFVTSANLHAVMKIHDGKLLVSRGGAGDGPNRYASPHDIEIAPDGRVVVADTKNDRLQILDSDLVFMRHLSKPQFSFQTPKFFSIDARGWIYLADQASGGVIVLDEDYAVRELLMAGKLNNPEGILVSGDFLWIADTGNNRIVKCRRGVE